MTKKQIGNIEVERHEATSCAEPYVVYLSVRTSTVKRLNLTAADAMDLLYGLQWALGEHEPRAGLETPVEYCKCAFIDPDGTVVAGDPCQIHPEVKP